MDIVPDIYLPPSEQGRLYKPRSSREIEPIAGVYTLREIYFKELTHTAVVRSGKSQICRAGQLAGDLGRIDIVALA